MAGLKDKNEQYSVFLKLKEEPDEEYNNQEKKRNKIVITQRVVFTTFLVVLLFSCITFICDNFDKLSPMISEKTKNTISIPGNKKEVSTSKFNFKMLSRYQNILLLGVDSNGPNTMPYSGVRSDTMIILSMDIHNKSINAISIPRDSKVYLADGQGIQKINAAYALGGIELTKKTIEETLGIRIHNYVIVNSEGVKKLIDTIGGVPIYIDNNMHYDDRTANLHIHFKKGYYVLSGEEAEGYLRFRKDYLGDIGRVHRQQKFVKALIEQIKSPEALRKIPEALKIASLYTRTDLNLYQMSQYAAIAREIDLNKVEFVVLPGAPNKKGIISYWILDPEETQKVINRLIYRQKIKMKENDISVGIIFPKSKEIEALSIREKLKNAGYNVNCTGRSTQIENSQLIGFNSQLTESSIRGIRDTIPEIHDFKYVHSPIRTYCDTSDIVITMKNEEE